MSGVPKNCPGPDSDHAGLEQKCKGCPNQSVCSTRSSDDKLKEEEIKSNVINRLKNVKNIILIMSGKGGVGKSTLACNIARALALDEDINVGLLDIDISGPSIPQMFGINNEKVFTSNSGMSPFFVKDNLCVLSCTFLLESHDKAIIWRGPRKDTLIKHFLKDVDWDELDYLIVDTPPGTSDEHLSSINLLKNCPSLKGAIIISTPQKASLIDVKKQVNFCNRINLNIIGVVENMSNFNCINCNKEINIFKPNNNETVDSFCKEKNLKFLDTIPIDPIITKNSDLGISSFEKFPDSIFVKKVLNLVNKIKQ